MSPVYSEPVAPASVPVAAAAPVSEPQPEPELLAPYTLLGSEQQEFRGKAAYMQRLGRYQTLFHESWIQPLEVEARSLPIVLDRSGDTGVWPRLQGSVKLYLSRYAHLETNLWLNTDGSYLPGQWSMPAPPLGPPSLVIEEPVFANEPDSFGEPISVTDGAAAAESAATTQGTAAAETGSAEAGTDAGEALVAANILEPVYPYRHAVTLQQKRRMRSGEIHYIDHPMFGIVIKLTPLNPDDLPAPN